MAPLTRRAGRAAPMPTISIPTPSTPRTLHPAVEVAIIGGGLCGTLAAAELVAKDGASVLVLDAAPPSTPAGGVWATAANAHSRLQAAACLYEWDAPPSAPRLTTNEKGGGGWGWFSRARAAASLARVPAPAVRAAIERFATEAGVAARTRRGATVTCVREGGPGGGFWVEWEEEGEEEEGEGQQANKTRRHHAVAADAVIVAAGLLGRQLSPSDRGLPPGLEPGGVFRGMVTYGGRQGGVDCAAGDPRAVGGKRVLVLGSGAFGLEAAEAAVAAGASSVTVLCRPGRDRWVAPFSRQFALAAAAACPLLSALPRLRAPLAAALNAWLRRLYTACGLAALAPRPDGPLLFTGQCHDGWFRLSRAGALRVVAGSVGGVRAGGVLAEGVEADTAGGSAGLRPPASLFLPADVVVVALGCALNDRPPFLAGLDVEEGEQRKGHGGSASTTPAAQPAGLGLRDLHSFAFFGRRPRLGLVCDWVWFNVPHGPKQQIACFRAGLAARRAGPKAEAAFKAALVPTPFAGCKGESLAPAAPSGFAARAAVRADLQAAAAAAVAAAAAAAGRHPDSWTARASAAAAAFKARASLAATRWLEWGWLCAHAGLEAWANWGWLEGGSVA